MSVNNENCPESSKLRNRITGKYREVVSVKVCSSSAIKNQEGMTKQKKKKIAEESEKIPLLVVESLEVKIRSTILQLLEERGRDKSC